MNAELGLKAKLMIAAYQLWLALAWNLGGTIGDWMTRHMARLLRSPGVLATIGSRMNFPYHVQWTRGYPRKPFMPTVPMLFVYGTRKPFMFHSQSWATDLAVRPHSAVHALRSNHWVSHGAAAEFNALALAWLDRQTKGLPRMLQKSKGTRELRSPILNFEIFNNSPHEGG